MVSCLLPPDPGTHIRQRPRDDRTVPRHIDTAEPLKFRPRMRWDPTERSTVFWGGGVHSMKVRTSICGINAPPRHALSRPSRRNLCNAIWSCFWPTNAVLREESTSRIILLPPPRRRISFRSEVYLDRVRYVTVSPPPSHIKFFVRARDAPSQTP